MSCAECKYLQEQYALARKVASDLADHRNSKIWQYDPDPDWQLDMLVAFVAELCDQVGDAFVDHRLEHRRASARSPAGPRPDVCKIRREPAPEACAVRKLMGWVKYSSGQ
jgi:hypothetical protein